MRGSSEEYMDTVRRIEPDVHPLDRDGALASIAISQRRQADNLGVLAGLGAMLFQHLTGTDATVEEVITDAAVLGDKLR